MRLHTFSGRPTAIQPGDEIIVERTGNDNVSYLRIVRNGHPLSASNDAGISMTNFELPVAPERVEGILYFVAMCRGLEVQLDSATDRFVFQAPSPA